MSEVTFCRDLTQLLPKGVTKVTFVYVKRVKAKTGIISHHMFPEYGLTNAGNGKCGITPDSHPKKG